MDITLKETLYYSSEGNEFIFQENTEINAFKVEIHL